MTDYTKLGKEELIRRLEDLQHLNETGPNTTGAQKLLHDLQVHQVELEMQNRELKEAQAALEESRDRYADLYDFAPVGYATFDNKGVILEINLTAAGMLGAERGRLIGQPFLTYVSEASAFFNHLRQCLASGDNQSAELLLKAREGREIPVQLISQQAGSGDASIIRASLSDITERKQAEKMLEKKLGELELMHKYMVAHILKMEEVRQENKRLKEEITGLRAVQEGGHAGV